MLPLARAVNDPVVGNLVQVGAQIVARTFPTLEVIDQLREDVTDDVVGLGRVVAEAERVFIDSWRVLLEDRGQSSAIHFPGGLQEGGIVNHG